MAHSSSGEWLVDAMIPTQAQVYDYLLGGKDARAASRDLAGLLEAQEGGGDSVRRLAQVNRGFVVKGAQWAASVLGTGQFLDLGCGYPRRPAVHDAARAGCPEARVVYVDRDLLAFSNVANLQRGPGLAAVRADVSDPARVLELVADLEVPGAGGEKLIDLTRPACVILGGTLSTMDPAAARSAVAGYAEALAPGSCVIISCVSYADPELGARMAWLASAAGEWHNHSPGDVEKFFLAADLRIVHGRVGDARRLSGDLAAALLSRGTSVSRSIPPGPLPEACVLGGIGVVE